MNTVVAAFTLFGLAWFTLCAAIGTAQAFDGMSGRTSMHFEGRFANFAFLLWCCCAIYTAAGAL